MSDYLEQELDDEDYFADDITNDPDVDGCDYCGGWGYHTEDGKTCSWCGGSGVVRHDS